MNAAPRIIAIRILTIALIVAGAAACAPAPVDGNAKGASADTGNVEGIVTEAGEPAANIAVKFHGADAESEADDQVALTDSDGHYVFQDLVPGFYIMTISLEVSGKSCVYMNMVDISAGTTQHVDFAVGEPCG